MINISQNDWGTRIHVIIRDYACPAYRNIATYIKPVVPQYTFIGISIVATSWLQWFLILQPNMTLSCMRGSCSGRQLDLGLVKIFHQTKIIEIIFMFLSVNDIFKSCLGLVGQDMFFQFFFLIKSVKHTILQNLIRPDFIRR